jgi:hypothetical protein
MATETSRYSCQVADLSSMAEPYGTNEIMVKYSLPALRVERPYIGPFFTPSTVPELHEVSPTAVVVLAGRKPDVVTKTGRHLCLP